MEHVLIRKLEDLAGTAGAPRLGFAVEIRDRPGPVNKTGAWEDDDVWVQLHGGLFVAKARIRLCWVGEYSDIREIRARTKGSDLYDIRSFWTGRPKWGYAAVASLKNEQWLPPFWAGPRTYGYEWIRLDEDKKAKSWLERKEPPRGGEVLRTDFDSWLRSKKTY
jgi:hypothetical protein